MRQGGARQRLAARVGRFARIGPWLVLASMVAHPAEPSLFLAPNAPYAYDHGRQLELPPGFGAGEFTLELWIRPDRITLVGPVLPEGSDQQRTHWATEDPAPYSSVDWWYRGNFLLDGHNNADFAAGSFDVQIAGGGRVRWLLGDGTPLPGDVWAVQAHDGVRSTGRNVLDGAWHAIALVRRDAGGPGYRLELWVDGVLEAVEDTILRRDLAASYWSGWEGFPIDEQGWFWGAEKQAAIGSIPQYEDYKGLIAELRFWNVARSPADLAVSPGRVVSGNEPGLAGHLAMNEGSGAQACDALAPGAQARCIALVDPSQWVWSSASPFASSCGLIGVECAPLLLLLGRRRLRRRRPA